MSAPNIALAALVLSFSRGVDYTPALRRVTKDLKPCLSCGKNTSHKKQCCSAECFRKTKKGGA